ncbi:unnamed protein product [Brassica rapa subsp. narinosa]
MGQKRWMFLLAIFSVLLSFTSGRGVLKLKSDDDRHVYNHTLTLTLVEYASAVYVSDLTELFNWTCERCNGLTKGFEVIEIIFDVEHCLQAYVGVAKDLNAIIIAFRGTQEHSIQNWVSDLFWKQLDLNYPDMPDAMVHHGFYSAYHNTTLRPAVLGAVQRAKISYGANINIIVTGHSMGGAMAAFCGLDLVVNEGEENVQVMTFGQPRVGNAAFASYYSLLVPNTFRITHEHDMVPHLPPYYHIFPQKTYHHFPTEVWVRDLGFSSLVLASVEKVCDNTGEDPTCSRSVVGNSISDHLKYFGIDLRCETWRQCTIVMSHEMDRFSRKDSKGNLVMSRTLPSTTVSETEALLENVFVWLDMEHKRWVFLLAIFACLLFFSRGRVAVLKWKTDDDSPVYNHTLALTLVEYTSAVYMSDLTELFTWTCERCNGLTKGFQVIEIIVDIEHCLQGYVGVAKDLNAIVIAFRGTQEHSIQNWVSDLFWKQLDLNYPDMPDAMVHHGFYSAYHNTTVRPAVLDAVKRAKKFYGENIKIMVTGHSMGGAMAAFCGLDLVVNEGYENVQVMTFGQPRIGNAAFASYYSLLVPNTFRITHDRDIVPHLPPFFYLFPQKTYHHFPTEVWVRDLSVLKIVRFGIEKVCDNTGEDPTCCRSVMGSSISDHLTYFGVELMSLSPPVLMEASPNDRLHFGVMAFGCDHYNRRCQIRAPCCNEVFSCRHCHNESTSTLRNIYDRHELVRQDVKQVICSVCDTEQPVAQVCTNCGVNMGEYFCDICKFYDDNTAKEQFHCDDCGICRVGGRENFFHCKKCGSCYAIGLRNNHRCVEDSMRHHCPICYEYLFDSLKDTTVMKCGHTMHFECYHEMLKRDKFCCPICSRSVIDMSKTWQRMDEEIEATSMPSDYRDKKVWILCNDCNDTTEVNFHIIGQKCGHCRSYNTRAIGPPVLPQ